MGGAIRAIIDKPEADAKDPVGLPSRLPLQRTDQPTRSPGQTIREHTDASENDLRPADSKAA